MSDLMDAGVDAVTASKVAGLTKVNTTSPLDHKPDEDGGQSSCNPHIPHHSSVESPPMNLEGETGE